MQLQLEAILNYCYCGKAENKKAIPRKELVKKIRNRIRNMRGGFIKDK